MNKEKVQRALTMLAEALREPDAPRSIQTKYFNVRNTRFDSDELTLRVWHGDPEGADLRVVMQEGVGRLNGKVLEVEVLNNWSRK